MTSQEIMIGRMLKHMLYYPSLGTRPFALRVMVWGMLYTRLVQAATIVAAQSDCSIQIRHLAPPSIITRTQYAGMVRREWRWRRQSRQRFKRLNSSAINFFHKSATFHHHNSPQLYHTQNEPHPLADVIRPHCIPLCTNRV